MTKHITIFKSLSDKKWREAVAKNACELLQHFDDPTNSYTAGAIIEYPNAASTIVVTYDTIKSNEWELAIKFIKRYRGDYTIKRVPESDRAEYLS